MDMFETPHYTYHDLLSGEECEVPKDECATSVGYNVNDGRIYYVTSRNAEAVFTPIRGLQRAEELGITLSELEKNE